MDTLFATIAAVWEKAIRIWIAGGWCMPAIAFVCLVMFAIGIHLHLVLRGKGFERVREATWRRWLDEPSARRGRIGRLIDFVSGERSLAAIGAAFREVHSTEVAPFQRDMKIMKVCIASAPLLGLLGTVTGMLGTFEALATGSGGEQTMDQVARGISEALITTEAGLVVALPGVFFQYSLSRKFDRWLAFLAHLETVCSQAFHRATRPEAVVA